MQFLVVLLIVLSLASQAAAAGPCTNGSFEELTPLGFPVDWQAVGGTVEVSSEAHSGRRALRLLRTAETKPVETGLNRDWRVGSGQRGAMIDRLSGGIDFWYKAISAEAAGLNIYAIPMTADPIEKTDSSRTAFTVPEQHIGDGHWHHARLKYNFTKDPKAKWVHFGARIVGAAGELLLDDFSYVERVGGLLRFGTVRHEEDATRPGERCTLRVPIENVGDALTRDVRAKLDGPLGLKAVPAEVRLGNLRPDEKATAVWTLEGSRTRPCTVDLTAASGEAAASTSFDFAPTLAIKNFGPHAPVATRGVSTRLECVLANTGHATLLNPRVRFALPGGNVVRTAERLAPGRSLVLKTEFIPVRETMALKVSVLAGADNVDDELSAETTLVVGAKVRLPPPSGELKAIVTRDYAVLENKHVRLAFRRSEFGFGSGELSAATGSGWNTVAWLPSLGRVVHRDGKGIRHENTIFVPNPPEVETAGVASLDFDWTARDTDGTNLRVTASFKLAGNEKSISADYKLASDQPRELLAFDGPMLHVLQRDEAVFPGLEWLVDDEVSSSTLDIVRGHPHQLRYVVHPNMVTLPAIGIHSPHGTVGLLWDVHQKWDGKQDRPSVLFASPDRFDNQRAHVMGLFLPTVPDYVEPNKREATKPYPLDPSKPLRLRCRLFADGSAGDALAAVDEWIRLYGLPEPAPLPHGSYNREIEFSMEAYLKSLWIPQTHAWWTTKGNRMMSKTGRPRLFVADLLLGEIVSTDANLRRACRARADEILGRIGGQPRLDTQRFDGRADLAMANPASAAGLLASRGDDGAWRFDADHVGHGPFEEKDYHDLGPDDAVQLGTCARKAFEVLRYARIAGDREAYERMEVTLRLMESFRVPRAAQVWEVPVHTPDVLAAADAVDAYVEAYRFCGEQRWLQNAVTWARRGLPFIYLWKDPEKPFLVGASIPVFGATWYQGSWFGRPVQWNGLRYANSLLKLAEYDQSYAWRQIAETVIRSCIHQQELAGEDVALWPDNVSAIDAKKCPWIFSPRQIIRNILKLTGRDEDPATVIVGEGKCRTHITATAKITQAARDDSGLSFRAVYPRGEQGVVLISNVDRPSGVRLDGKRLAERDQIEDGPEPGWRYDAGYAFLAIRIPHDGESVIRVEGAAVRKVSRLPWPVKRITFEFDDSLKGWIATHDIARMTAKDGMLVGTITGGDPYLIRSLIRVRGDACPVIRLRMRVTAGGAGQLFWTTESSPQFDEEKKETFALVADGEFHEYRLKTGSHPRWSGETITGIRIDPTGGAATGEFAIDYVRGCRQ